MRNTWIPRATLVAALSLAAPLLGCGDVGSTPSEEESDAALTWIAGNQIRVSRAALGQEWLLQASSVSQAMANMSTGLQSKIVRFEARGDELVMQDVGEGQSIGEYHSALAKFPIVASTGRTVTIDFNAGMRSSFLYSADWHSQDDWFSALAGFDQTTFELKETYVVDGRQDGNRFVIRQAAQVDFSGSFGEVRDPELFVYYLQPYTPNRNYQPMLSPGHEVVSFFENTPHYLENLKQEYQVTRFDSARPIRYAISADVPADFRAAVREGVLYWNTVMGRRFVEVVDAPTGRHAPDPDLNIIEWINWDDAGFAYADAQVDPRTGETLHAQVYLTSGWAVYSRDQAFRLAVADAEATEAQLQGLDRKALLKAKRGRAAKEALGRHLSVLGLHSAGRESLEDRRVSSTAIRGLNRLAGQGATNAQILEASRDIMRIVTAHEVGHTLGLRHNFAGSVGANYSVSDAGHIISEYLANNGTAPAGLIPSSSVMDYAFVNDDFITGDLIGSGTALPYDVIAMHVLYDGAPVDQETTPAMCNDEGLGFSLNVNFTDCNAFDVGGSILDNAIQARDDVLGRAVTGVLEKAVAYVTDPLKPRPVEAVTFDPAAYAFLAPYGGFSSHLGFQEVLSYFYPHEDAWGAGILSLDLRQARNAPTFPFLGELEEQALLEQRTADFLADLAAHDPLADLMAPLNQDWVDAQQTALDAILANPALTSGVAPNGTAYALTAAELDVLREKGHALLQAMPQHYFAAMTELAAWFVTSPLDGPSLEALASVRARIAHDGVFAASHQTLTATVTLTSSTTPITQVVTLPVPLFAQGDRLAAIDLLGGEAPQSDWNTAAAAALIEEIETYGATPFGVTWQELVDQQGDVPHPLRRWVEDLIALHEAVVGYSGE